MGDNNRFFISALWQRDSAVRGLVWESVSAKNLGNIKEEQVQEFGSQRFCLRMDEGKFDLLDVQNRRTSGRGRKDTGKADGERPLIVSSDRGAGLVKATRTIHGGGALVL